MIIARICLPGGHRLFHGSVEIVGSPAEDDYRQKGWFPVDSFNFGFNAPADESKNDQPKSGTPPAKGTTSQSGGNAPNASKTPSGSGKAFSEMQISKEVDRASCDLMVLAMEERSKKKGADRGEAGGKELHADVHVLGSVQFKDGNIFPSLMIHLECVRVAQWGINGSGDNRPSESITLQYDRAAMHYTWFDGAAFLHFGPKGWDQKNNKPWEAKDTLPAFERYKPVF
jgi:type VI protein secretion system component Hcp